MMDQVEYTTGDGYVSTLASPASWHDNVLNPAEIARHPGAKVLAAAFANAHAMHTGVNASDVRVLSIARDMPSKHTRARKWTLYPSFA